MAEERHSYSRSAVILGKNEPRKTSGEDSFTVSEADMTFQEKMDVTLKSLSRLSSEATGIALSPTAKLVFFGSRHGIFTLPYSSAASSIGQGHHAGQTQLEHSSQQPSINSMATSDEDSPSYAFKSFGRLHADVTSAVACIAASPSHVLAAVQHNIAVYYSPATPKATSVHHGDKLASILGFHKRAVTGLDWLVGESHTFASCSKDGKVCVIDTRNRAKPSLIFDATTGGSQVRWFTSHGETASSGSGNHPFLASVHGDTVRVWDTTAGKQFDSCMFSSPVACIDWVPLEIGPGSNDGNAVRGQTSSGCSLLVCPVYDSQAVVWRIDSPFHGPSSGSSSSTHKFDIGIDGRVSCVELQKCTPQTHAGTNGARTDDCLLWVASARSKQSEVKAIDWRTQKTLFHCNQLPSSVRALSALPQPTDCGTNSTWRCSALVGCEDGRVLRLDASSTHQEVGPGQQTLESVGLGSLDGNEGHLDGLPASGVSESHTLVSNLAPSVQSALLQEVSLLKQQAAELGKGSGAMEEVPFESPQLTVPEDALTVSGNSWSLKLHLQDNSLTKFHTGKSEPCTADLTFTGGSSFPKEAPTLRVVCSFEDVTAMFLQQHSDMAIMAQDGEPYRIWLALSRFMQGFTVLKQQQRSSETDPALIANQVSVRDGITNPADSGGMLGMFMDSFAPGEDGNVAAQTEEGPAECPPDWALLGFMTNVDGGASDSGSDSASEDDSSMLSFSSLDSSRMPFGTRSRRHNQSNPGSFSGAQGGRGAPRWCGATFAPSGNLICFWGSSQPASASQTNNSAGHGIHASSSSDGCIRGEQGAGRHSPSLLAFSSPILRASDLVDHQVDSLQSKAQEHLNRAPSPFGLQSVDSASGDELQDVDPSTPLPFGHDMNDSLAHQSIDLHKEGSFVQSISSQSLVQYSDDQSLLAAARGGLMPEDEAIYLIDSSDSGRSSLASGSPGPSVLHHPHFKLSNDKLLEVAQAALAHQDSVFPQSASQAQFSTGRSRAQLEPAVVAILPPSTALPTASRTLASQYRLHGRPSVACQHNSSAAGQKGCRHLKRMWQVAGHATDAVMHCDGEEDSMLSWRQHPLVGGLLTAQMMRLSTIGDTQTVGTLAAIGDKNSLLPFLEGDSQLKQCADLTRVYSQTLRSWGMLLEATAVGKRVTVYGETSIPPVGSKDSPAGRRRWSNSRQSRGTPDNHVLGNDRLNKEADDSPLFIINDSLEKDRRKPRQSSLMPTTVCFVCRLPVRGRAIICPSCGHGGHAQHVMQWFESHTSCPNQGCRCQCLNAELPFPSSSPSADGEESDSLVTASN